MQSIVIRNEYIMFYCHLCFEKGKEVDEVCCKMWLWGLIANTIGWIDSGCCYLDYVEVELRDTGY